MMYTTVLLLSLSAPIPSDVDAALWQPEILTRDRAMLATVLDLDPVEQEVVEELIDQYVFEYEAAAEQARAAVEAAALPTPVKYDWGSQHDEWTEIRGKAARLPENEQDAYLESMREWAGDTLEEILEGWPPVPPSSRRRAIQAWGAERARLRRQFLNDLGLIFEEEREGQLALADAELRVAHDSAALTRWALPLERVNLAALLLEQFDYELPPRMAQEVDQYLLEHGRVLEERAVAMLDVLAARTDAEAAGDPLGVLRWTIAEMALRQAVVEHTMRWYDHLGTLLDKEALIEFQRRLNEFTWPAAFAPSKADRIVAWALAQETLDPEVALSLRRIRAMRGAARLGFAARERAALRLADQRRPVLMAEQQAMAALFGDTAMFGIPQAADVSLEEAVDLAHRRSTVEASAVYEIRQRLGDEWWNQIPSSLRMTPHQRRVLEELGAPMGDTKQDD